MLRFLAILLLVVPSLARVAPAQARPDVVVIVWNDAELAHIGSGATPRLDALLAAGARFPRGLHAGPRGRPTDALLLTGRLPHQNGVYYELGPRKLAGEGSLGTRLAAQGYASVHVGRFTEGKAAEFGFEQVLADPGADDVARAIAAVPGTQPLLAVWAPSAGAGGAAELDALLGELLDALEARGTRASALVAFVPNGKPRGHEFSATECSAERMRCPLALVWPGHVTPGERDERVTPLDVLPTVLDALGIPAPEGLAGRSLLPLVAEPAGAEPWSERALGAAYYAQQVSPGSKGGRELGRDLLALVLVTDGWKYALFLQDVGVRIDPRTDLVEIERSAGDQVLFDLGADPREEHDLSAEPEHAARLDALRARAVEWWSASGGPEFRMPFLSPPLGPPPDETGEPRPNIVLVIADDMDYEHMGFMGNPRVETPTLDALARDGLVFPVAHVPMSRCRPSLGR
jgi:arylsulfatase A-like enzyme